MAYISNGGDFGPLHTSGQPDPSRGRAHRMEEFTVLSRHPTLPPRIYYTCMNSSMQLGLLWDLLHLHELVIGNLAFMSDSSVLQEAQDVDTNP